MILTQENATEDKANHEFKYTLTYLRYKKALKKQQQQKILYKRLHAALKTKDVLNGEISPVGQKLESCYFFTKSKHVKCDSILK